MSSEQAFNCNESTIMKTILCLIATFIFLAAHQVYADAQSMAKQRAKEAANKNNASQGVGSSASSAGSTAPQQAAQPSRPLPPDPVAKLKADIAGIAGNSSITADQKKQLIADMLACARGSQKPMRATVEKFANSVASALAGKGMEPSAQSRLVQNINLALNSASLSEQRTTEVADDVLAILQTAGVNRATAVSAVGDLKAIAVELQASN